MLGQQSSNRMFPIMDYAIPVSIDGATLSTIDVDVSMRNKLRGPAVAYCGVDGKAAIAASGRANSPARSDARGVLHILSITMDNP